MINGIPVHLASNGGHLPADSYTVDSLVALQHRVANMESQYECRVNTDFLTNYLQRGDFYPNLDELKEVEFRSMLPEFFELTDDIRGLSREIVVYSWSFIEMAKKGFFSFDRGQSDNGIDYYHLVAWPQCNSIVKMERTIQNSMKEYRSCCFPPFHEDYGSNLPEFIRFQTQREFEQINYL